MFFKGADNLVFKLVYVFILIRLVIVLEREFVLFIVRVIVG